MSAEGRDADILGHIVQYCEQIDQAVLRFGDDEGIFISDVVYQNATALCLLQIGELVGHLTEMYRNEHSAIPWRQIRGMRNIIAHHYGILDAETTWEIVKDDIPSLRRFCEKELKRDPEAS